MSSTATALSGLDDLNGARKKVLTTDFFALCYLMLCQLAYTEENDGQKAVAQIKELLPTMPVPDNTVKGQWKLGWGPAVSKDNGNLLYAAEFIDTKSGSPVFSAVAIRGTDTSAKPAGLLQQIMEDLDAEHQVVFPENNTVGAKIARGTSLGLGVLTGFRDDNTKQTVEEYLNGFVVKNPGAPIVVTGHSLGGCQTTVLALYLASRPNSPLQRATIVPNSFAANSAGNQAFIELYEKTFPRCPRWFNTRDLVPMAYAGLNGIDELWSACERPAPLVVKFANEGLKLILELSKVQYKQQSDGQSRPHVNGCQNNAPDAVSADKQNEAIVEIKALMHDNMRKLRDTGRFAEVVDRRKNDLRHFTLAGVAAHLLPHGQLFDRIVEGLTSFSIKDLTNWVRELLFQHLVLTGYWAGVEAADGVAKIPIPEAFVQAQAAAAGGKKS